MPPKKEASSSTAVAKTAAAGKKKTTSNSSSATTKTSGSSGTKSKTTKKATTTKSKPNPKDEGGLERVLEPEQEDALARAEQGEVSSETIIGLLEREEGPTEETKEEEEVQEQLAELILGPAGDDPWGNRTRVEEWEALEKETAPKVVVENADCSAGGHDLDINVESKIRQKLADEASTGVALVASECEQSQFPMSEHTCSALVQLDLSNNRLGGIESLVATGFLWLRELKLAGNKLKGWPSGFAAMPALISLDLSFNPGLSLVKADFAPLAGLWKLDLAGCELESLTAAEDEGGGDSEDEDAEDEEDTGRTVLAGCPSLTDLNLSENAFTRA
eukprot:CAMPEP_0118952184 /NCGR_PEP_ID=MMETSP1169-20130426/54442_1 /TAXON_ID=36882 /ORGANISM="Pyramimonas obovata, Strain CCMP722" /LENGTH=332 /DNA_ID=CAMNT_0006899379 /DNA_START=54 /DNA_END=1048 /DNA_ORIENTATION=+